MEKEHKTPNMPPIGEGSPKRDVAIALVVGAFFTGVAYFAPHDHTHTDEINVCVPPVVTVEPAVD